MKRPAVFLDRDGVLNEVVWRDGRPGSPRRLAEFRLAAGIESVQELRAAGFWLFVVTNQPDVARGLLRRSRLAAMMAQIVATVQPDAVR
jgi:D-glycero-D-manno-heptose 1,7-bisphosphate phosphatase